MNARTNLPLRWLPIALLSTLALPAAVRADRADHEDHTALNHVDLDGLDAPTHWASRHSTCRSRMAITTDNGKVTLLLTDDVLAMQLSDRTFHKVRRELRDAREDDAEDGNVISHAVKAAVISTVSSLMDHSAECDVDDVRDVAWQDGRLVIVADNGRRLFEHVDVDDSNVMNAFSERDGRAFARAFREVRRRHR